MTLAEKFQKTGARAAGLMKDAMERLKNVSPEECNEVQRKIDYTNGRGTEEFLNLSVFLSEYENPKMSKADRYAFKYQGLMIFAAYCGDADRERALDVLLDADAAFQDQKQDLALKKLAAFS